MSLSATKTMVTQPSINHLNVREYRTTEFRVGGLVLIEESRRQDHKRRVSSATSRIESPVTVVSNDDIDDLGLSQLHLNINPTEEKGKLTEDHVMSLGRPVRRSKQRPVVIHAPAPRSVSLTQDTARHSSGQSDLRRPPPTPRFQRLPTPDLSDLEDRPFCECCGAEHTTSRHRHLSSRQTYATSSS